MALTGPQTLELKTKVREGKRIFFQDACGSLIRVNMVFSDRALLNGDIDVYLNKTPSYAFREVEDKECLTQ